VALAGREIRFFGKLAEKLGQENKNPFPTFSCPNFPAGLFLPTCFGNTDNLLSMLAA
jgi:hypothetical protein